MQARSTPQQVERQGIRDFTPQRIMKLAADGQTVMLVSRAEISGGALRLRVQPEVMPGSDLLATARGTSNLLLLHTDLLGTIGTLSIEPGVEQTAYGLFSDLVDVARSI
jgi:homoserine dehydrogenase